MPDLHRFISTQEHSYSTALSEIRAGRKRTHWMWYIFPQISGLGNSEYARLYAISDLDEAADYMQHPVLGPRLIEISKAILDIHDKTAHDIFGSPDDMKLRSCMTLFSMVKNADPVFKEVLDQFYSGEADEKTVKLVSP